MVREPSIKEQLVNHAIMTFLILMPGQIPLIFSSQWVQSSNLLHGVMSTLAPRMGSGLPEKRAERSHR